MIEWIWKGLIEEIWPNKWHSSHPHQQQKIYQGQQIWNLLAEEKNSIKSIEYEERLIDYDEDYESYNPYLDWDGSETFY